MTPRELDAIAARADASQCGHIAAERVPALAFNSTRTREFWATARADVLALIRHVREVEAQRDGARDLAQALEEDRARNCTCEMPW